MTTAAPSSAGRVPWLALGLGLAAFLVLISLGTWQVERLQWKEGLLATIEARAKSPPRPLAEIEAEYARTGDVDYEPVRLQGRLLNDREDHYLATRHGGPGYFVYTPLQLGDGRVVFVNRGFVPDGRQDPATRPQGQMEGVVTITGLARNPLPRKPSWVVPENEPDQNIFYWKDMQAMAARSGVPQDRLLPFFVDADATPNPGSLPLGGVTIIDLPNNHLQYAFTWYGLALVLAAVLAARFGPGVRAARGARKDRG